MHRNSIKNFSSSGESACADYEAAEEFLKALAKVIKEGPAVLITFSVLIRQSFLEDDACKGYQGFCMWYKYKMNAFTLQLFFLSYIEEMCIQDICL